jgi:hypothetical protein
MIKFKSFVHSREVEEHEVLTAPCSTGVDKNSEEFTSSGVNSVCFSVEKGRELACL